jgi:hypothetical protein
MTQHRALIVVLMVTVGQLTVAHGGPMTTASEKTKACSALGNIDFSNIQDAPTQLTAAKLVEAQWVTAVGEVHSMAGHAIGTLAAVMRV